MSESIVPDYYHYGLSDDFYYSLTELDDLASFKARVKIYTDEQAFKYLKEQSLTHLPESRISLKIDIGFLSYIKKKLVKDLKHFYGEAEIEPLFNDKFRIRNVETLISWIDEKQTKLNEQYEFQSEEVPTQRESPKEEISRVEEQPLIVDSKQIRKKVNARAHALFILYLEEINFEASPLNKKPLNKGENTAIYASNIGITANSFTSNLSRMRNLKKRLTQKNRTNIEQAIELLSKWPNAILLAQKDIDSIDAMKK